MSDSAPNGNPHTTRNLTLINGDELYDIPLPGTDDQGLEASPAYAFAINADSDDHHEEPLQKRRKIVEFDGHKSSPRAISPPWKKITADGPTTYIDNGRRRSGRTNVVPLEQQPQFVKRQTRAAYDKSLDKRGRPSNHVKSNSKPVVAIGSKAADPEKPIRRGPGRPPKAKVEAQDNATHSLVSPPAKRRTSTRGLELQSSKTRRSTFTQPVGSEEGSPEARIRQLSPPLTLQKVRFRVALPQASVQTPANVPPPKKCVDFRDFLDKDPLEPFAGQDTLSSNQVKREALARYRVYEAERSGKLAGGNDSSTLSDKQAEPAKQFAHHDHLLGHVCYFSKLLLQERKEHKKRAEQIAYEAKRFVEEKRKRGRVKTTEELAQEYTDRMRLSYRHVVKDMDRLWLAVQIEVSTIRQRQFEEEQQARIKNHLNRVLERTDEMLTRQEGSELTSDVDSGTASPTEDESDDSDSEVMSSSSSGTDAVSENGDPDENLTAEQLRAKYEALPELHEENDGGSTSKVGNDAASTAAEESDPDIEMDSEFNSDESDDKEDEDEDEPSDEENGGLLSLLFTKKEVAALADEGSEAACASAEGTSQSDHVMPLEQAPEGDMPILDNDVAPVGPGIGCLNHPVIEVSGDVQMDAGGQHASDQNEGSPAVPISAMEDIISQDVSIRTSPGTSATKRSEPDSISSPEPQTDVMSIDDTRDEKSSIKTPVPSLLRGTLRQYQHEGLDWLANLYANGRSGILADEMGLGKTIQSIALLAHLATEYEVWGPHLIVVPTSVMLNWEIEFKKFLPGFKILTYYGSLEERKQKRRGWMADDSFNVCITSYQLVLQDANSFKRRRWHCMILDEAHNIKNFRSERWQTMMTFNTRARLLLTGTPLQNNLTELWSLLFFLHYGQEGHDEDEAFAGLKEWSEWFKRPVESILEHGRQVLDQEDKEQVAKLHKVIRPFLLRRLKADVEKQMPAKYEHVELCRLSKRQRQLYDGFMSRAQTKETLASGNYLSIINALMQLRKVCNHPDLFETRPINTSFAMPRSVAAEYEIKDLLVRRKMFGEGPLEKVDLDFLQLVPISNEKISLIENAETKRQHAYHPFKTLRDNQWSRTDQHALLIGKKRLDILTSLEHIGRNARLQDIDRTMYYEAYRHHQCPIYGRGILEKLDFGTTYSQLSRPSDHRVQAKYWDTGSPIRSLGMVQSVETRSHILEPFVQHYACVTPPVVATDLTKTLITDLGANMMREELKSFPDPFHRARMKLSIAFPDKRLLQYDCGKLQRLDWLLRQLQSGGHRALIFTQMTKVLDILEQFLNIHGHRYLRLDGATKIEQRQILTDRFNNDQRILCFILSSRSGGLGINLTGADTVIFYDLDWNPAMDRQCTDRAHRIGQTRDVHIYRFVSEHTIESNILRKANQKQLLDDVVIKEGDFTTDYMNKLTYRDMLDEQVEDDVAGAAMDRVLGQEKTAVAAFEHAEDQEDASAAKVAAKEVQHADDGDFEDGIAAILQSGEPGTPASSGATNAGIAEVDHDAAHHIDDYLLKLQTFLFKDVPLAPPRDKGKRGRKRGDDHRKRRPR